MLSGLTKITQSLTGTISQFERLGSLPFIWILVFLQFGFLIVIRPMFPNYWDAGWTTIVLIYIIITITFVKLSETLPDEHKPSHSQSLSDTMILYPLAFIGMYIF